MKYVLKRSVFLIIIFSTISLFLSLSVSAIQATLTEDEKNNDFLGKNAVSFSVNHGGSFTMEDISFFQDLEADFLLYKESPLTNSKMVLFKGKQKPTPPLLSGRYFTQSDFNENKRVAVIGKNLVEKSKKVGESRYIMHENFEYLVIGVIGYPQNKSPWDYSYYVGLIHVPSGFYLDGNYSLDAGENTQAAFQKIKSYLKSKNSKIEITELPQERVESPFRKLLKQQSSNILIILAVLLALALNTVNFTSHWIEGRKKELAVRKACGGTDAKIVSRLILEYEAVVAASFFIGFVLYLVIVKGRLISFLSSEVYFTATAITFIGCLAIGLVTAIAPAWQALKLEVNEIMR